MNPYAFYLGSRDPIEVISDSPHRLAVLLETLGSQRANQSPAPGKWSVREILCHLADTELVFAFRLRQTLAEPNHVIQPFDQDRWAGTYAAYSAQAALEMFGTARKWNLALIRSLPPDALATPVTHPERGQMTFQTMVETMGGHDLNHIQQIERLVQQ